MSEQLSGRELDKAIALALGYTVRLVENVGEFDDSWFSYAVFDADGKPAFSWDEEFFSSAPTEAEAWQMIPAFRADANAVIDVCAARGWYLSFTGNSALIAYDIGGGFSRTHRGDGATPQEAAARALLAAITAETGAA